MSTADPTVGNRERCARGPLVVFQKLAKKKLAPLDLSLENLVERRTLPACAAPRNALTNGWNIPRRLRCHKCAASLWRHKND